MFTSPETITSAFWRASLAKDLLPLVSFVAIDEVHCVRLWGKDFRPSYLDLQFLRSLFPSVPIMALSATLPPLEFLVSRDIGLCKPYLSVSLPLDRPNIFYAVKRKQGLSVDLASLVSCMKSAACPQQISKTVIFCLTKDSCHSVYVHLWKNVSLKNGVAWIVE